MNDSALVGLIGITIGWFLNVISVYFSDRRKEKKELNSEKRTKIDELLTLLMSMNEKLKKRIVDAIIARSFSSSTNIKIDIWDESQKIEAIISLYFRNAKKQLDELSAAKEKVANAILNLSRSERGSNFDKDMESMTSVIENAAIELIRACIMEIM